MNLRLKIEGRRADGYHLLSMINVCTDLCDEICLEITESPGVEIEVSGSALCESDLLGDPARNLAARAAAEFLREFHAPGGVKLHLRKRIPIAAGLGGGSSDAAAVFRMLYAAFVSARGSGSGARNKLFDLALSLGADVPFFLSSGFAHVGGVGEVIQEIDTPFLQGMPCLLALPQAGVSSAAVYQDLRRDCPVLDRRCDAAARDFCTRFSAGQARELDHAAVQELHGTLLELIENDLEPWVCRASPEAAAILKRLRGCGDVASSITGSGSAMFCLPRRLGAAGAEALAEVRADLVAAGIRCVPVKIMRPGGGAIGAGSDA